MAAATKTMPVLWGCALAAAAGVAGVCAGAVLLGDSAAPAGGETTAALDPEVLERRIAAAVAKANADLVRELTAMRERPAGVAADPVRSRSATREDRRRDSADATPVEPSAEESVLAASNRHPPNPGRLDAIAAWNEDAAVRGEWILRSRAEVAAWFGVPHSVVVAAQGIEIWTYELGTGNDGDVRRVSLRFSATGLMDAGE